MEDNNNISQELLETIERYINGYMAQQELNDFNQLLELDDAFKAKVEDIKTMLLGIEVQALKEKLDDFHKEIPKTLTQTTNDNKVRFLNFNKIAVAAAIIVAVGSIWFFNNSPNEKLYAKYFKPDPGLPTTMSTTDDFDFYDAMVNYKHGDYSLAIDKWNTLSKKRPTNDTLNYFLGVAHLANKNEIEAIPFLEKTVKNKDFALINDAYHYLGLSYLKDGNIKLAKKYFSLSNNDVSKELVMEITD